MIIPMLKGLALTLSRFFSKPITTQYPKKRFLRSEVERGPVF
jgi:formate hydrogenlyase subunit 6/NADH:ubiquinone oxidoreductase subunit I